MADKIHLSVVTAEGTVFDRMVSYVNIPTDFGSLGVLNGHAPMMCSVGEGRVRCTFEEDEYALVRVGTGIANVADNEVTLLVSDAELLN